MRGKICLLVWFLVTGISFCFSQDIIYRTDGTKFTGKVTEITPREIKYKSAENPTGPTYVVSRDAILLIEYKNGKIEFIASDPKTFTPGQPEAAERAREKKKSEEDLLFLNKNTVMLNGAALANSDITFMYDRDFADGYLTGSALVGYNFNLGTTWPNAFIDQLNNAKKNYDLGLGISLNPFPNQKVQYYMGLLFKYMNFSYDKSVPVQVVSGTFTYTTYEYQKTEGIQLSSMFVNGLQVRITPTFNYKFFLGIGGFNMKDELYDQLNYSNPGSGGSRTYPKVYLGTCFGIRF